MTTQKDIHNAVCSILREITGLTCYSNEVIEGFRAPCFFVMTRERTPEPQCGGIFRRNVDVTLNFMPKKNDGRVRDEDQGLKMAAVLFSAFSQVMAIGDRHLLAQDLNSDCGGENSDILIFSFLLDFFDDYDMQADDRTPAPAVEMIEHIDNTFTTKER